MSSLLTSQSVLAPGSCGCTAETDTRTAGDVAERAKPNHTGSIDPSSRSRAMEVAAAPPRYAIDHFARKLEFETDCSDVNSAFVSGTVDFVLLDVRSSSLYRCGHITGSINIPVLNISEERLAEFPTNTNFVVYCAGPHCNGANKAALRLAKLGRPVKEMIGGITGWLDEGLTLVSHG